MYVIGSDYFNYISITRNSMMCDCEVWTDVTKVEYKVPLHKSTLFVNREDVEKILKEIRDRASKIQFQNYSIIGEITDKKGSFDKTGFVHGLKIYELAPREVTEQRVSDNKN